MSEMGLVGRKRVFRMVFAVAAVCHAVGGDALEGAWLNSRLGDWLFRQALETEPGSGVMYSYLNLTTGERFTTYERETP